jgi:hypothetical protein
MEFKKGRKVRATSLYHTVNKFGSNNEMEDLVEDGTIMTIDGVYSGSRHIQAGGWDWDKRDLHLLGSKPLPTPKPELFDIGKIDVCGSEAKVAKQSPKL